ncbi:hypothetical protein ACLB2K_002354 [Fragaria x ananassa]
MVPAKSGEIPVTDEIPATGVRSGGGGHRRVWNRNYCMTSGVARERVECVVIGAGVVGLCVARELALRGRQVLVLDSAPTFGTGTSSRNSEVIHAGIYYPPNSLKVRTSAPFSGTDFYRFSTVSAPATPFLFSGVISDLPRRCWNEEEGRRDRDRRSTMIDREVLSEIAAQTSDRSLRPSSSF